MAARGVRVLQELLRWLPGSCTSWSFKEVCAPRTSASNVTSGFNSIAMGRFAPPIVAFCERYTTSTLSRFGTPKTPAFQARAHCIEVEELHALGLNGGLVVPAMLPARVSIAHRAAAMSSSALQSSLQRSPLGAHTAAL